MTREEAIKTIRLTCPKISDSKCDFETAMRFLIPELRESEDERIRKRLITLIRVLDSLFFTGNNPSKEQCLAYLEKQKEQEHICDSAQFEEGFKTGLEIGLRKQKEQKPASTEDMPYITDEHFYEREPKDSFKYKLAEYMTQNCRKEESPDGYTYHISAETILEMAKEELIKRGKLKEQKPEDRFEEAREKYQVEWGEGDNIGWDEAFACVTRAEKAAKNEEELQNAVTAEKWLKEIKFKYYVHPVKQEWSEEDEKIAKEIEEELWYPGDFPDYPSKEESELYDDCQRRLNWFKNKFKSLRERFNSKKCNKEMDLDTKLQDRLEEISRNGLENAHTIDFSKEYENSKQILEKSSNSTEWSEEEYGRLFDIEHYLDGTLQLSPDRRIACIDFLKALRPSWKPSEDEESKK